MSQEYIIKKVIENVRAISGYREMRILDLSCGEGGILQSLYDDGCGNIEGTHYREDDYVIRKALPVLSRIKVHKGVALDRELPLESGAYDIVILTEVIEHLPNHFIILSEIARMLKPGGFLFLTTPNIQKLHSRMQFLFTGTHKLIRRRIAWDIPGDRLYEYHINALDFHTAHAFLGVHSMRIRKLVTTRVKARHLYVILLYPFVLTFSLLQALLKNRNPAQKACEVDLFRMLCSPKLLFSEQVFLIAEKATPKSKNRA